MENKKPKNNEIKKPRFVLTDEAKFYLATKDITDTDKDDMFFIASLFCPVKRANVIVLEPHTEIATFDDAESASIYYETVSKMVKVHENMENFGIYKEMINKFNGKEK